MQQPGSGDAVSAVVARAAQHRNPAFSTSPGQQSRHGLRDPGRRPLHQLNGGDPPFLNGLPVQFLHLRRRCQLHIAFLPTF